VATLILSPHLDDAVLSCWHLLDGGTDLGVINVFAGVPPADAAGSWDLAAGLRSSFGVVEQRRAEDGRALALAGRKAINLDFLDDQYVEGPHPIEPVVDRLRELLAPDTALCAPAALAPPPDALDLLRWRAGRIRTAIAQEIGCEVDYLPVDTDGARRAGQRIAEML
jgi:hypothetical protein